MDFNNLTAEEKEAIRKAVLEEEKTKEAKRKEKTKEYKGIVDETVKENFNKVEKLAEILKSTKLEIFKSFEAILELKEELYGIKETQRSHTFTTSDGSLSIIIGHRIIDSFDDTVHSGIAKVKDYISKLTTNEQPELEKLIDLLLKKDKNGNLKASRVLELEAIANENGNETLLEGVKIIKEAYKPSKSSTYVEAYYKDKTGKMVSVPLSITSVIEEKNGEDKERAN